jgi:hypothetical protein
VLSGLKERPRVGGRGLGGWSETLEGSCLTFTPNTTALHSVPIGRGNLISGFFPFSEIGSGAYGTPPLAVLRLTTSSNLVPPNRSHHVSTQSRRKRLFLRSCLAYCRRAFSSMSKPSLSDSSTSWPIGIRNVGISFG